VSRDSLLPLGGASSLVAIVFALSASWKLLHPAESLTGSVKLGTCG
jgi:hypothetical protein